VLLGAAPEEALAEQLDGVGGELEVVAVDPLRHAHRPPPRHEGLGLECVR
jgi:hypothetical protein